MGEINTIGLDLAKNVFQLHGVTYPANMVYVWIGLRYSKCDA